MASTLSDQERITLQRRTVTVHMKAENIHEYDRVNATFVQAGRAYYRVVPGGIQYDGIHGAESFYELLDKVLPHIERKVTTRRSGAVPRPRTVRSSCTPGAQPGRINNEVGHFADIEPGPEAARDGAAACPEAAIRLFG